MRPIRLGVNIDHVATIRNARGEAYPDPARAAEMALAAGADGMDLVRRIVQQAAAHLEPGGLLFVEVGDGREALERIFPDLRLTWPTTSAGDDMVFLAHREDLVAG